MAMTFEAALTAELMAVSALNKRVYPHTTPEEKYDITTPYLIFVTNEGLRTKEMSGYQSGKTVRGELNVIAKKYEDMKAISALAITKIVTFEQRVIGTEGPYIQELIYREPVELYEDKPKLYRCLIDFEVYF